MSGVALVALFAGRAEGTVSVTFSGDGTSITTPALVNQKWELTLIAGTTTINDPAIFNVNTSGDGIDTIRFIKVRSYDPDRDTIINIGSLGLRMKGVEQVTLDTVGGGNGADDGYTIVNVLATNDLGPTAWNVHKLIASATNWTAPLTMATHATKPAEIGSVILSGNWTGNITFASNTQGFIDTFDVGKFGTISPNVPVTVQMPGDWNLFSANEVNATIRGKSTGNTAGSYIGNIRNFSVNGPFKGKLMATGLSQASGGSNSRTIDLFGNLESGSSIILANGLVDAPPISKTINFLDNGLVRGQVILNGLNSDNNWSSDVLIGPPSLQIPLFPKPAYTNIPVATLGGGSVGLVPYRLNIEDSFPRDNEGVVGARVPKSTMPIQVRHYGPLTWSGTPVVVKRRQNGDTTAWSSISPITSAFTIPGSPVGGANPNIVTITPPNELPYGWEYQVTPVLTGSNALKCVVNGVTGPVVTNYSPDYRFCVGSNLMQDLNGDLVVNTADLTIFNGLFGQSNGTLQRGDFNGDGAVTTPDLTSFLGKFGLTTTACRSVLVSDEPPADVWLPGDEPLERPGAGSENGKGGLELDLPKGAVSALQIGGGASTYASAGTPPGPLVAALGFTTLEAYGAYVEGLTERELQAHFALLLAVASGISGETP